MGSQDGLAIAGLQGAFREQSEWYGPNRIHIDFYYDIHICKLIGNEKPFLTNEEQRENDRQKIRELFKQMLDIAAKATEEKKPEMSIMFDGIGLVLAFDYVEAVSKIFSTLKIAIKNDNYFSGNCLG